MFHYKQQVGRLNDPNGPCYWKGRYHLFYQHIYTDSIAWGHAVCTDLIHWEELPDVILPVGRSKPGDAGYSGAESCWCGAVCVDDDRVVAVFYGHSNNPETCGLYVMAASDDMLCEWKNVTDGAAIPSVEKASPANVAEAPVPFESVPYCNYPMLYDPCIWKEDGVFYVLSGGVDFNEHTGGVRRQEFLFESTDLVHWTYRHPMIAGEAYAHVGDDGACPYFAKWNDGKTPGEDHRLLLHFSHQLGPRYLMGVYDKEALKFTPYAGGLVQSVSKVDGYYVPALFTGTPDGSMLAAYIMGGRGRPTVMSMVHCLERCGEHLEEIAVSPAVDIDALPCTRTPESGEEKYIPLKGETTILKMHIGYAPENGHPVVNFHRKDGTVFGKLRLNVGQGAGKRRNHVWRCDDIAVLNIEDRPDCAPPQFVRIPRTEGVWNFTLVMDEDALEIFYPDAWSMGRRIYGDIDGMYLSIENGKIIETT